MFKVSKEKTMTENLEMPNETEDRQRILLADDEASIRRILETRML